MLKIREANPDDLDAIISLCEAHAAFEGADISFTDSGKKDLASLLFVQKQLYCLVAESNQKVVGYTTLTFQYATWTASRYLYMDCLYVSKNERGQGIGKALMSAIKDYMAEENIAYAQWQTPAGNQRAISFYHQLGAEAQNKTRFFWAP